MKPIVLILGPTGRLGRNAALAFEQDGWDVRRFNRKTDSLWDAAWGASVIVNGWNPPYTEWATDVPKFTAEVIEVAKASGATVMIPGNVYVYGPEAPDTFHADTPHAATNPLGRIRIEMEAAYRAAGVRSVIVRAGDYIDTEASGNWFDMIMTNHLSKGWLTYPGPLDTPHAFNFLPDVAETMVALANKRHELDVFEDIAAPGYTLTGNEMADALSRVTGRTVQAHTMRWLPIQIASPLWPMGRKLLEMRYLWSKPHRLPFNRLAAMCPDVVVTPLEEALARAIEHNVHPDKTVRTGGHAIAAE